MVNSALNPDHALDAAYGAKSAVTRQLKDPGSAEFQNVNVYKQKDGTYLVCGEVNARNSFGAMPGYTRFISPKGAIAILETSTGASSAYDELWDTWGCSGLKGDLVKSNVALW